MVKLDLTDCTFIIPIKLLDYYNKQKYYEKYSNWR